MIDKKVILRKEKILNTKYYESDPIYNWWFKNNL